MQIIGVKAGGFRTSLPSKTVGRAFRLIWKSRFHDDRTMALTNSMSVQRFRTARRDKLSFQKTNEYFHKYCLCLPKEITNSMRLFNGQVMYLEQKENRCVLRPEMRNQDDHRIKINEAVTRRINGKTYTVTRFTIPNRVAKALRIDKGDTVDVYEGRDGIVMRF